MNATSFKGCCPASFSANISIAYINGRYMSTTPNAPQPQNESVGVLYFSLSQLDNDLLVFGTTDLLPFNAVLGGRGIIYDYDSHLWQVSDFYTAIGLPAGNVPFFCAYQGTLKKQ